jgi:hypothetical protein
LLSSLHAERLIGGTIAVFGVVYCLHTVGSFDLGTFRRIGPGMFPLGLGLAMTVLGVGIAVIAPDRERGNPDFSVRTMILVLAGIAGFAATVARLGLAPAIVVAVLVSSVAERPFKPVGAIGVAAALCIAAWLIFKVGLGLSIPMFDWRF